MGYQKSRPRLEFDLNINDIIITLRKAKSKKIDPTIRKHVIASGIFCASAIIENYIQDFFNAFASAICKNGHKASDLPENLRAILFFSDDSLIQTFRNHVAKKDEFKLHKAIFDFFSEPASALAINSSPIPNFSGGMIYQKNKYPSPENLDIVYKRIGVGNIFNATSKRLRKNTSNIIQSFNDQRTSIAHNGVLPGVTPSDVASTIRGITSFIGALDHEAYLVFSKHFGANAWSKFLV